MSDSLPRVDASANVCSSRSGPHARAVLTLLAATFALTGCLSIGGDRAELAVYAPQVTITADPAWPRLDRTLAIAEPNTSTALDSNRIAVRPTPAQLQVYAGAIWSDTAPALVQSALVDALGDSGRFRAVVRPIDGIASDLLLRLDLRQFEAVYGDDADRPTVVVELQATLLDPRGNRVLATRTFRTEKTSADEDLPEVIAAFDIALEATATAMTPWLLEKAPPN